MRKNYTQAGTISADIRLHIAHDWYPLGLPPNLQVASTVFIDSSYGFAGFQSVRPDAMFIDEGSGCYDRSSVLTSDNGKISIGKFTILNGTTLICKNEIIIGDHCMLAWGSVITDWWLNAEKLSIESRRALLKKALQDPLRPHPFVGEAKPVVLENNCWVGFDAVVLSGVRLGKGCVVGCKTVVDKDVPPYAVVAGSPAQIVRYLQPTDTAEARRQALQACLKK